MLQVVFEDRNRQPIAGADPGSSVAGLALPVVPVPAAHHRRLKPLEGKPAGTLLVHEIYRSLQGESTFAGLPCVFIRLTACHLRCVYCDTPHAFTQGEVFDLNEILARALRLGDSLVEITGGEPLLQPEV
jgi:7-carboxy-7-deazaguanine synthase